ncbi:hypothetical protein QE152_g30546 [Popillia japonica]|uniref:Uncharacterized protein n=1 Tax=Popillia japonica TaxID=7064 RepID=A0AAW1JDQ2_POPJA
MLVLRLREEASDEGNPRVRIPRDHQGPSAPIRIYPEAFCRPPATPGTDTDLPGSLLPTTRNPSTGAIPKKPPPAHHHPPGPGGSALAPRSEETAAGPSSPPRTRRLSTSPTYHQPHLPSLGHLEQPSQDLPPELLDERFLNHLIELRSRADDRFVVIPAYLEPPDQGLRRPPPPPTTTRQRRTASYKKAQDLFNKNQPMLAEKIITGSPLLQDEPYPNILEEQPEK